MDRLAIVGHGPSMLSGENGSRIDECEVMRLKRSSHLLKDPIHYGSKTDYVTCSFTIGDQIQGDWPQVKWFFLFTDTRNQGLTKQSIEHTRALLKPAEACVDPALCNYWIMAYRENRLCQNLDARQETKGPLSDEYGHLHPSAGFFSILYSMVYLKPSMIELFGFDSLTSGKFDWSVTRGEDWRNYPDHNWSTEHKLLPWLAKIYGYRQSATTLEKI